MSTKKKSFIFTDCDLDGAGSYMLWPWFTGGTPDYITTRVNDFGPRFKSWVASGNLDKYERVYILDLDVSTAECFDLVDNEKVTIIDHHQTHVDNIDKYKHAKLHVSKNTSCIKSIYTLFKKGGKELSDAQKMFIAMVDDYDSYNLKLPQSYHLNLIYWNYQGDRLSKLLNDFKAGFSSFTEEHQNIINFYLRKLDNIKKQLDIHHAVIPIGEVKYRFVSVFADQCINEVADHIIKNSKADVGMVINLKSNKVSIRKSKSCELKLGSFATKMFGDNGGGHDDAAGGIINDKFLQFSSLFKPAEIKIGT